MNLKLTFAHYATNKAYPIYLFEHDFTGMIDLEAYVAAASFNTRILDSSNYYTWTTVSANFQLNFPTITGWVEWDGSCD